MIDKISNIFQCGTPYGIAFLIGSAIGLTELLSKYGWSYRDIFKSPSGWIYNTISGVGSLTAYGFVVSFGLLNDVEAKGWFWRVLVAAVLGIVVFRSSFANLNFNGKEFSAGLGAILNIFKQRAERSLDQGIQERLYKIVLPIVKELSFEATKDHLTLLSCEALRSLGEAEKEQFMNGVARISDLPAPDGTKMQFFGLMLIRMTGESLFRELIVNTSTAFEELSRKQKLDDQERTRKLSELKAALKK